MSGDKPLPPAGLVAINRPIASAYEVIGLLVQP
jgi:hypothetical protein